MFYVDAAKTGSKIRKYRRMKGYKLQDLADRLEGISMQSVSKWERGQTLPSVDNLLLLSNTLGVKVEDIVVVVTDRD